MTTPVTTSTRQVRLDRLYSSLTLMISGLSSDGSAERHLFLDLTSGQVREVRIDLTAARARHRSWLTSSFHGSSLPYGSASVEELLPYFLHPHSAVQTSEGSVAVSYKQAPWLRVFEPDGRVRQWPEEPDVDLDVMFGSTACEISPGVLGFGTTDARERLARYRGADCELSASVSALDLSDGTVSTLAELPSFLLDTVHEVASSPAGFFVAVDMNLSVQPDAEGQYAGTAAEGLVDVTAYARNEFPLGRFVVADADGAYVRMTAASCSAHVSIDDEDPTVFYVSSNNLSKWRRDVVIHGPGVVESWRFRDGTLTQEASYSAAAFLRITSQQLFHRDGRRLLAVTGYPNRLFVLDPTNMQLVQEVELFSAEVPVPPFACSKNGAAPLYLAVAEDGDLAFLSSAEAVYVVDLIKGETAQVVPLCEPGSFLATAHIALVRQ